MVDEQIKRGLDNFASANLRVGFLLDDHPGASYVFDEMKGAALEKYDASVAKRYAEWDFVVCLLTIPGGKTHVGWKDVPTRVQRKKQNSSGTEWVDWQNNPENYVSLQTKALGRALKRAGYPDNMGELRALVLWRHRNAALRAADGPIAELEQAFDAIPESDIVDEADVLDVESEEVTTPVAAPPAQQQALRDAPLDTNTSPPTDNLDMLVAGDDAFRALYEPTSASIKTAMREWITQRGKTSRTAALAWLRHLIELEAKTVTEVKVEGNEVTVMAGDEVVHKGTHVEGDPPEEVHPATRKVEEALATAAAEHADEERRALGDALREKLREWEESDPKRYDDAMAKLVAAEIWVDEADLSEEDVDRASRILFHGEEV